MMVLKNNSLVVRKLVEVDAPLMAKWLSDPRVLEFYEGRDRPHTLEMVQEVYIDQDEVMACIVEYEGKAIGFIQYYPLDEEERDLYGYDHKETIYGMDQFIGEVDHWGKGIGTQLVKAMTNYLIQEEGATRVVMDPRVENVRAIRCYEKSGYKKVKIIPKKELHEGVWCDCWLMEYQR